MDVHVEPWILARHEILEKLGEGAMGVVDKARDRWLDRLVAVKFLAPSVSRSAPMTI